MKEFGRTLLIIFGSLFLVLGGGCALFPLIGLLFSSIQNPSKLRDLANALPFIAVNAAICLGGFTMIKAAQKKGNKGSQLTSEEWDDHMNKVVSQHMSELKAREKRDRDN